MLLKEQGSLQTPVGMFSEQHESVVVEPDQAQFYKQLLPLSKPKEGEQYAFKVDLDRCTGCKACVSACHSLNGLDDHETWRDVGTIHGTTNAGTSYTQTVTTACHHCADPGCLNGCPVLAYEKDPETGIVRHLDDQCIGCQYCSLKCPYDVPKYSKTLGIVRKCDMCHSRLAEGEAPACVQSCPTEAISITIVNAAETLVAAREAGVAFLPGAPDGHITAPTTQYVTRRRMPQQVEAADLHALVPEHGHYPLVSMLVLMQLSVGLYTAAFIFQGSEWARQLSLGAFLAMITGLICSLCHLGRPLGAWRAFLGVRQSWLSREIVVFGQFSLAASMYTFGGYFEFFPAGLVSFSGAATLLLGWLGTLCSVMIYADTKRPFWRLPVSAGKFFGSAIGLGFAGAIFSAAFSSQLQASVVAVLSAFFVMKLSLEGLQLTAFSKAGMPPEKKSALLMLQPLRHLTWLRYITSLAGLFCFVALLYGSVHPGIGLVGFILLIAGEILERTLYFKAVAAPKMPGGVKS